MPRDFFAVFSGGGVKGVALVAAFEEACAQGLNFVGWGGTSAGSIVATLLACGYSSAELRERLYNAPYSEFFKVKWMRALMFNRHRGLADPAPLLVWIRALIAEKHSGQTNVKFNDLRNGPLKIVAANITTREIVVYSKKNTPNTEVAEAVLASCSFPILFPPVPHGLDEEVIDGGVLSNFPMWLFDEEHADQQEFVPVLGFALISRSRMSTKKTSPIAHALSVFDSILVAQDRVQEKYMDIARLSNVIRIDTGATPTFSTENGKAQHDLLLCAGKEAVTTFFNTATVKFGEAEDVPPLPGAIGVAQRYAGEGNDAKALSTIAREHIVRGGVARDSGFIEKRVLVKHYIDLMAAVTDHDKVDVLASILAKSIGACDRIVGIKKGNVILAYAVALQLRKPISFFKTDMSYKMGPPFDGAIKRGERIVVVDDIASDANILLNAVRHLNFRHSIVGAVVTLIDRVEGDARDQLAQHNISLISVCSVDDEAIKRLIDENRPFPLYRGVHEASIMTS